MAQGAAIPQDEVLREFEIEYENIRKRVLENQQLIEQTQLEVGRIRDRHVAISAQLSRVETNFDTIPRADIKAAYDSAFDIRTRLLTLQGQLEKAKATLKELQHFEELLGRLLRLVRSMGPDAVFRPVIAPAPEQGEGEAGRLSRRAIINVVEAQEAERQRLARQMHDGPAQSLTNFILQAEICQRLFDRNPDRAEEELGNLKTAASTTFQKVRDFIFDLRPMMLDDLGLVPTMRRYVEGITNEGFTGLTLKVTGKDRRLAPHKEITIFRVIQALIHIAREQDQATNIVTHLNIEDDEVRMTMEDNGVGFEIDETLTSPDAVRLNLPTLRERIEMLNGTIRFASAPGKGLRVSLRLPVEVTNP